MNSSIKFQCPVQWATILFLYFSITAAAFAFSSQRIPTLVTRQDLLLLPREGEEKDEYSKKLFAHPGSSINNGTDYQTFYYQQTVDHFNYKPESYATFNQRYVINAKYWGGAGTLAPIFVYLGAEAKIDGDLRAIGFLSDHADQFKALQVYIEHRFYGQSIPFRLTMEETVKNESVRGYFNSAQALEDYAEVIIHIKEKFNAHFSPVIVIGGSYGGMLASWFRLKYPHVALGALASSAPILYFDDITPEDGYYSVVTKDFRDTSLCCYESIRQSWDEIDRVASEPEGLSTLSKIFKTCAPLNASTQLKDYLNIIYATAAQYGQPPVYAATTICNAIDGAIGNASSLLGRIYSGLAAYKGEKTCYDMNEYNQPTETNLGWTWQTCSEMVMPIGFGAKSTMYPSAPFNLSSYEDSCEKAYGVMPRQHWITNYYGGHDIRSVLGRFGSNIIFSNGLKDPYSSAGVLEDISESIVAIYTLNGSHCMDILPAKEGDPDWLVRQRKHEVKMIHRWIEEYYARLHRIAPYHLY